MNDNKQNGEKAKEENKKVEEEKFMAWSCCNNIDKNSQGCEKMFVKFDSSNIEHNIL